MSSILKVNTIQDTDGNNIINESGNVITIGASGDTITVPAGATVSGFTSAGIDDNATSVAITIDSSENVGIGTTTPGRTLDVAGIVRSSTAFALGGNTSTPAEGSAIYRPASDNLAFVTNNNERLRINSSGNVGIGTSSPSNLLHLTSSQNGTALQIANTVDTNGIRINSGVSGLASNSLQFLNSSGDSLLIIDGTNKSTMIGNIGPSGYRASFGDFEVKNLDGSGNPGGTLVLSNTDGSIVSGQQLGNLTFASYDQSGASTTGGVASIRAIASETYSSTSGAYLSFLTHPASANDGTVNGNMVERMRIDSSGNLFVATTTEASDDVGHALLANGAAYHTTDGTYAGLFNRKSSNGEVVQIRKDNTVVGKIGIETGGLTVDGEANHSGIMFSASSFLPRKNYSSADGTVDLGTTDGRWKDLYLGGGAFIGGTGSANKLDDFEIGTWTPSLQFGGGTTGIAYSQQFGNYTKIGRLVHIKMRVLLSNKGSSSGAAEITGFPFNAADDFTSVSFEKGQEVDTWNNMASASNYRFVFTDTGQMNFKKIDTNGTTSFGVNATDTDFNNASDLRITFTYTTT